MKKMIVWGMTCCLILSGCQSAKTQKEAKPVGKEISLTQLTADIQQEFREERQLTIIETREVERDESLSLDLGFDPEKLGIADLSDVATVFQDPDLTQRVNSLQVLTKKGQQMEIRPPRTSLGAISTSSVSNVGLKIGDYGNQLRGETLFSQKEYADWGNLPQYYLAIFRDLKTGKKLSKPEVILFTVKTEIDVAPKVILKTNPQGITELAWEKVKGAAYYYIMEITDKKDSGIDINGVIKGKTEGTTWEPSPQDVLAFSRSEADIIRGAEKKLTSKDTQPEVADYQLEKSFVVIGVNEKGTSPISNRLAKMEIARRVPHSIPMYFSDEIKEAFVTRGFADLPTYSWVTMADGTLVQRLVRYDIKRAFEEVSTFHNPLMNEDGTVDYKEVNVVTIPYVVEGTNFFGQAKVGEYQPKTYKDELKVLAKRQRELSNKAGAMNLSFETKGETAAVKDERIEFNDQDKVTANSALSSYLARHMLVGKEKISLEKFPEALDPDYLFDAWAEAVYQNPLILGVAQADLSNDGQTLNVYYELKKQEMFQKQGELRREVKRVVSEIVTPEMTAIQKEIAINNYLVANSDYDNKALENAKENQFLKVDQEFIHSFNPYGVSLNREGVCASYAGAFKLLGDQAGLETIVVTGTLDGALPHAWNKVKIDDQWVTLDPTNNNDTYLRNVLLNAPDTASKKVLIEDKAYVMDQFMEGYQSSQNEQLEYYHLEEKFFAEESMSNELAKQLITNKQTTLRTNYQLTDRQFTSILSETKKKLGNQQVTGFYWLGVIYLERK